MGPDLLSAAEVAVRLSEVEGRRVSAEVVARRARQGYGPAPAERDGRGRPRWSWEAWESWPRPGKGWRRGRRG